jgi:hypothetical protein
VGRFEWNASVRVLALLLAAFMVAAVALQLVLQFDLTGSPPEGMTPGSDEIMAFFQFEHGRWPIDFASEVLFALGFMALAGVGILLSRLADPTDTRRVLAPALFLGVGGLGVAASLVWIGVAPIVTDPHYCTCDLRDALLAARVTAGDIAGSASIWLGNGAVFMAAIGFVLVVGLARAAGMSAGWTMLTWLTAAVALLGVVLASTTIAPSENMPIAPYISLAVGGILIPIWAVWLAISAPGLASPDEMDLEPVGDADDRLG